MAEIAFGVIGVVGVALDASITTYNFLANITGAPKAIKVLASHVQTLRAFLEPFHELISKPTIRDRAQNVRFIPSVENAVSGFESVLKSIEDEVKQYVKYTAESSTYSWGGWGSWRRLKYAFKKSSIIELEASLLGRMSALHMVLAPMDLSWTSGLTNDDRETIATLRRRASSLDATAADRRGSRSSLASEGSIWSWAGIEEVGSIARDPLPVSNVDPSVVDLRETFEELRNGPSEEQQNTEDNDNPYRVKAVLWSGARQARTLGVIDTGSNISVISKRLVRELEAPVNQLTTPGIPLKSIDGHVITTEGSVTLVLKVGENPDYNEARFHVVPLVGPGLDVDLLLGMDWLATTPMFRNARQGI